MSQNNRNQTPAFQAVTRAESLAQQVTSRIERMMEEGRLRPGDLLPSERELARRFGVSRTVVREALRTLAAKGLLATLERGGAVVCQPTTEALAQLMRLFLRDAAGRLDAARLQELQLLLAAEAHRLSALDAGEQAAPQPEGEG